MPLPDFNQERQIFSRLPFVTIASIDEVGRGAIAGPIVAVAVFFRATILNQEPLFASLGVNDSKKLSAKKRLAIFDQTVPYLNDIGLGIVSADDIDALGIQKANQLAFKLAIESGFITPNHIFVDGTWGNEPRWQAVVKGDQKLISIALASIIAKVTRDAYMQKMHDCYPAYGFDKHVGYGTKAHYNSLDAYGPVLHLHRVTFLKH